MIGLHLFVFLLGAFVCMVGIHNSQQLKYYPVSKKIRNHPNYQNVWAASGILVVLGICLMCDALKCLILSAF